MFRSLKESKLFRISEYDKAGYWLCAKKVKSSSVNFDVNSVKYVMEANAMKLIKILWKVQMFIHCMKRNFQAMIIIECDMDRQR